MEHIIPKKSGAGFTMQKGDILEVWSPEGQQVSDMMLFNANDPNEVLSGGKTLDYISNLTATTGHYLYSNRSSKMMCILQDSNGQNDFLLAPCCKSTFEVLYNETDGRTGCLENLASSLSKFDINIDEIPTAFNIFMNVQVGANRQISVLPPNNEPCEKICFRAEMDLFVGLTSCSAPDSNGGTLKTIAYRVIPCNS
jgi:uncharacterized protein YcgI (DUF1989 family)